METIGDLVCVVLCMSLQIHSWLFFPALCLRRLPSIIALLRLLCLLIAGCIQPGDDWVQFGGMLQI